MKLTRMEKTPENAEMQVFAQELENLSLRFPGVQFEDRRNPDHMKRHGRWVPCFVETMRFQAWRPVIEYVVLDEIEDVRDKMAEYVSFRKLLAWAATPKRLSEILAMRGGLL